MPYNGSGVFTLVDTVANATTADGDEVNTIFTDLQDGLTAAVAKNGESTMTGVLKLANGTAAAPALTFGSDTNLGLYRISADSLGVTCAGVLVATIDANGLTLASGTTLGSTADIVATANITDNAVTLAKLATQADGTVLANISGGVAVPTASTIGAIVDKVLTTRGDILRRGTSAAERYALGATGKALVSDGTDVAWGDYSIPNLVNGQVCLQRVRSQTGTEVSCATVLPFDNTIPQNTEGTEVLTAAITPISASSTLVIKFTGWASRVGAASNYIGAALFRDTTADALGATAGGVNAGTQPIMTPLSGQWEVASGSTSATTFKIRVGGEGGSVYFLGLSSGALWGGVGLGSLTIEEWLTV